MVSRRLGAGGTARCHPAAISDQLPSDRYLNRELSWLDFNARVLALAADKSMPLLERAKFLAIRVHPTSSTWSGWPASNAATRWGCRCAPPTV